VKAWRGPSSYWTESNPMVPSWRASSRRCRRVERLTAGAVLGAERRDRATRPVIRPLRDREPDTRIDRFIDSHHESLGAELSPRRPLKPSPTS
jgi:hypothetical protein